MMTMMASPATHQPTASFLGYQSVSCNLTSHFSQVFRLIDSLASPSTVHIPASPPAWRWRPALAPAWNHPSTMSTVAKILPLLMECTLEDQEWHLLVKVIDRVLYRLNDLVRLYVHKILAVIEHFLINEDYYAHMEGHDIISNLAKAAGLAHMISTMHPDLRSMLVTPWLTPSPLSPLRSVSPHFSPSLRLSVSSKSLGKPTTPVFVSNRSQSDGLYCASPLVQPCQHHQPDNDDGPTHRQHQHDDNKDGSMMMVLRCRRRYNCYHTPTTATAWRWWAEVIILLPFDVLVTRNILIYCSRTKNVECWQQQQ